MKKLVSFLTLLTAAFGALSAELIEETPAERDQRMEWFREARFGMFIHWGLYAVPAGEWKGQPVPGIGEWIMQRAQIPASEYAQLVPQFNPVEFNAREWVRAAKNAGMKYIVITSKHHDGFALFDSKLTDWDIGSTPFGRDPLKELAAACRAEGVRLCFYHSIMDWHHPEYAPRPSWNDTAQGEPDFDRYVDYMKGQLKELITGYGPLGILWFDGEWERTWTHERGVDLYNYVRGLQPDIIVNNRVGKGRAGMMGMDQGEQRVGDYGTPEQEIPPTGFGPGVDWESCMTMNDTWGFKQNDHNWKSTTMLVRNLIDCASKGGNYLLNVGPTAEGLIPAPSLERLAAIGDWMKVNSESIYGTTASPFRKLSWGRATQKQGKLYLHVFDWPADGKLLVPLSNDIRRARLLAEPDRQLSVEQNSDGVLVRVPTASPTPHAGVVVLELDGKPEVVEATVKQAADGTLILRAGEADLIGHTIRLETKGGGAQNIGYWTDQSDYIEWPVTITQPGRFDVEVTFACDPGSAGSECVMSIQDLNVRGTVDATGGWDDFASRVGGQITLTQTGSSRVKITAASKPGDAVMNLRQIRLLPAD